MLCVPGPWKDRTEFITAIVQATGGGFMFAGQILTQPSRYRHVDCEFCFGDDRMRDAFEAAGQGRLETGLLDEIGRNQSVLYLSFYPSFVNEREKLISFSQALQIAGGFAVKVESSGVAFSWETWMELITSDSEFDWYSSMVILVADDDWYYSCGMRHFELPDAEVPTELGLEAGAELINMFNFSNFHDQLQLGNGHTFSLRMDWPRFRLSSHADVRHEPGELYHNPNGLWRLEPVSSDQG